MHERQTRTTIQPTYRFTFPSFCSSLWLNKSNRRSRDSCGADLRNRHQNGNNSRSSSSSKCSNNNITSISRPATIASSRRPVLQRQLIIRRSLRCSGRPLPKLVTPCNPNRITPCSSSRPRNNNHRDRHSVLTEFRFRLSLRGSSSHNCPEPSPNKPGKIDAEL